MRSLFERVSPVLLAAVVAGGFVATSAAPAAADVGLDRPDQLQAERPTAASARSLSADLRAVAARKARLQAQSTDRALDQWAFDEWVQGVAIGEWYRGVAIAEWAEGVYRAEAARAASRQTRRGGSSASRAGGGCSGDVDCFLACTRGHESDTSGGYGAVSPGGRYRGAYQFAQPTWDAAVAGAGHAEYSGVPADQAPDAVQDAAAAHLYSASGTRPWGGRC